MRTLFDVFWNSRERRFRAGVRIPVFAAFFFLGYKLYLAALTGSGFRLVYGPQTPLGIFLLAGTVRLLPAIAAILLGAKFLDRRTAAGFGLRLNRRWGGELLFGTGLGAGLMAFIFGLERALGWISVAGMLHSNRPGWPFIIPFLVFFVYIFCQALFEEILARGYLFRNLAEGLSFKKIRPRTASLAAWISISIVFGLGHGGNPDASIVSTINLMLIGLTLGAGIYFTGRLALPIGLHFGWNFVQAQIFGFPLSGLAYPSEIVSLLRIDQGGPSVWTGGAFGPEGGLIGTAAALAGLFIIIAWSRRQERIDAIKSRD
jgi:membrane protease YdiL (CAAX protease family)